MKNLLLTASALSLLAACTVTTGGDPPPASEEDARYCQGITCGGHGTCRAGMDLDESRNWVKKPRCACSDGYIPENDDKLTCIEASADNQGWGYRFDAEPAEVVEKELRALQGDWFQRPESWSSTSDGRVVTSALSFNVPTHAGQSAWFARDMVDAVRGNVTFEKPATNTVKLGAPLGEGTEGTLAGFRPLEMTAEGARKSSMLTVLYKLGTEEKSGAKRPKLEVVYCPDSFTSGVARPKIAECLKTDDGVPRYPQTYVRPMFDR
jgi:hypothetical protein